MKKEKLHTQYIDRIYDLVGSENNHETRQAAGALCDLLRDPVIHWQMRWMDRLAFAFIGYLIAGLVMMFLA